MTTSCLWMSGYLTLRLTPSLSRERTPSTDQQTNHHSQRDQNNKSSFSSHGNNNPGTHFWSTLRRSLFFSICNFLSKCNGSWNSNSVFLVDSDSLLEFTWLGKCLVSSKSLLGVGGKEAVFIYGAGFKLGTQNITGGRSIHSAPSPDLG